MGELKSKLVTIAEVLVVIWLSFLLYTKSVIIINSKQFLADHISAVLFMFIVIQSMVICYLVVKLKESKQCGKS